MPAETGFFVIMANIIDIGSNSVRLFDGKKKTIVTSRLAADMKDGFLDGASVKRTVDAVSSLCEIADGKCYAFATEAVRKAKNKTRFLEAVKAATGLDVDVISGETEAEIGFLGAAAGHKNAAVIDLGGASCEIIFGGDGKIVFARSFPFGCVTMADRFGGDYDGIARHVCDTLALPPLRAESYIAVGGTATSLAALAQELEVYDPAKVDGFKLCSSRISELIAEIDAGKTFPTLGENRRKSIVQGAVVLRTVMYNLGTDFVNLSEKDNLEGYMIKHNIK